MIETTPALDGTVLAETFCADDLEWLNSAGSLERRTAGSWLAESYEHGEQLRILVDGEAEVLCPDGDSWRRVARLGRGSLISEPRGRGERTVMVAVRALSACRVLTVPRTALAERITTTGGWTAAAILRAINRLYACRLRAMEAEMVELLSRQTALLDVVDGLLSEPAIHEHLHETARRRTDLSSFRQQLLAEWNF